MTTQASGRVGPANPGTEGRGPVHVIFNPASGRGRGGRRMAAWLALLRERLPGFEHSVTTRAGEEADLAERAVESGAGTVVAVGGDGTWSHVADRLLATGRPVRFGVLPAGTGNDFARGMGIRFGSPQEAVGVLAAGRVKAVDVGRVRTPAMPTRPGVRDRRGADGAGGSTPPSAPVATRHFLNVVGFGFDVAVIDAAAGARFLRGEPLYKITALQQLFRFGGLHATLDQDGCRRFDGRGLMLTISNGRFFGGGFPIAPGARVDDGALHACFIADAPPLGRMRLFNLAEKGLHGRSHRVTLTSGPRFHVEFPEPPRYEVDGDLFQALEPVVEVEVLPGALEVVVP